jgi:hypothetical protein
LSSSQTENVGNLRAGIECPAFSRSSDLEFPTNRQRVPQIAGNSIWDMEFPAIRRAITRIAGFPGPIPHHRIHK